MIPSFINRFRVTNAKELVTDRFAAPVAIHTGIGFILLGAGTLLAARASGEQPSVALQQLSSVEQKVSPVWS